MLGSDRLEEVLDLRLGPGCACWLVRALVGALSKPTPAQNPCLCKWRRASRRPDFLCGLAQVGRVRPLHDAASGPLESGRSLAAVGCSPPRTTWFKDRLRLRRWAWCASMCPERCLARTATWARWYAPRGPSRNPDRAASPLALGVRTRAREDLPGDDLRGTVPAAQTLTSSSEVRSAASNRRFASVRAPREAEGPVRLVLGRKSGVEEQLAVLAELRDDQCPAPPYEHVPVR